MQLVHEEQVQYSKVVWDILAYRSSLFTRSTMVTLKAIDA